MTFATSLSLSVLVSASAKQFPCFHYQPLNFSCQPKQHDLSEWQLVAVNHYFNLVIYVYLSYLSTSSVDADEPSGNPWAPPARVSPSGESDNVKCTTVETT